MSRTIKQWGDEHGIPVSRVKSFLRANGPRARDEYRPPDLRLTPEEQALLDRAFEDGSIYRASDALDEVDLEPMPVAPESVADLAAADRLPVLPALIGGGGRDVRVHQDVLVWMERNALPSAQQSLTRALKELMERGWVKNSKGVRGVNSGWRRAPFGGNNGMQFYLWYCDGSCRPAKDLADSHTVLVRAVRHHDDTAVPIQLGAVDRDYVALKPGELLGVESGDWADPLSPKQREIVASSEGSIVVKGHPGAGKTTALQHVLPFLKGRVRYVTFSPALLERARNWWSAFQTQEAELEFLTFADLVATVIGAPPREPLQPAQAAQALGALLRTKTAQLGPWVSGGALHADELHAELHAYLFGHALPVAFRGRAASSTPRLSDRDYLELRQGDIGADAARTALLAASAIGPEQARELFPQPVRAFAALQALARGALPPALTGLDAIVVDEIQDLTVTELFLLTEIAFRCARASGRRPRVIVAGDESQTVRPTGFEWRVLGDLLYQRLGKPADFELAGNVRSPADLATVVSNSWGLVYGGLGKRLKPRGVADSETDGSTVGRLMRVHGSSQAERMAVLTAFRNTLSSALVIAAPTVPEDWKQAADSVGVDILTADAAKGLDFPIVGLLEAGATLAHQQELAAQADDKLSREFARVSGDRLRVALSRATSTLVLIDSKADARAERALDALCGVSGDERLGGDLGLVDLAQLEELLAEDAADAIDAVLQEMEISEKLLDNDPPSAWTRLQRSKGRLGKAGSPGAVSGEQRRRFFALTGLAGVLSSSELESAERKARLQAGNRAFHEAGLPGCAEAARLMARRVPRTSAEWTLESIRDVDALVRAIPEAAGEEVRLKGALGRAALLDVRSLAEADLPATAAALEAVVSALNAAAEVLGGTFPEVIELRTSGLRRIFEQVLERRRWEAGAAVIEALGGPVQVPEFAARLEERRGALAEAAAFYERAGRLEDALRCLRAGGETMRARDLATATAHRDAELLTWLAELQAVLGRRPAGELTEAELAAVHAGLGRSGAGGGGGGGGG